MLISLTFMVDLIMNAREWSNILCTLRVPKNYSKDTYMYILQMQKLWFIHVLICLTMLTNTKSFLQHYHPMEEVLFIYFIIYNNNNNYYYYFFFLRKTQWKKLNGFKGFIWKSLFNTDKEALVFYKFRY